MSLASWQALGYDLHSIISSPAALFVDQSNNNYHLKPNSPAIAAGAALPEVTDDLDGHTRPPGLERGFATLAPMSAAQGRPKQTHPLGGRARYSATGGHT